MATTSPRSATRAVVADEHLAELYAKLLDVGERGCAGVALENVGVCY